MNSTNRKGTWQEQKQLLKLKLDILKGNNLMIEDYKNGDALEKLQIKLGKSKEELTKILNSI